MKKVVVGLALAAAAVLAPSAVARSHVTVKLPLVPLPASSIGSVAKALPLQHDSGVVSNATAAADSFGATTAYFNKLGRVTGYALDYGDGFSKAPGVTEVQSEVDRYKTTHDANNGILFWRLDDSVIGALGKYGFQVSEHAFPVPKLGRVRFGDEWTGTVPGVAPNSVATVQVADGTYVLSVDVGAASVATAKALATTLVKKLDARLHQALAGHLHGTPAKLPAKLKAGPPQGGPDLSTLPLTTTDLGQGTVTDQGYNVDPQALSDYGVDMQPGGSFDLLSQEIEWYPTADAATFLSAFREAGLAALFSAPTGSQFTPVDLSSVGDDARGAIIQVKTTTGSTAYLALVALAKGEATDLILGESRSTAPQASDLTNLAQLAANKLNAAVTG